MAAAGLDGRTGGSIRLKHVLWAGFGLMALVVLWRRDLTLLDPHSFLRQRYAQIPVLMFLHGIPAAAALCLGVFQFSERLRRRYLQVHRVTGRVYVACALVAAPVAILVSWMIPVPTLFAATCVHVTGWVTTTATGFYCVRTGRIQQHREWMTRSYPFAMVFIVARAIGLIPAVARLGEVGVESTVWSTIAVAGFLPSFLIAWQALAASKRTVKVRAAA